MDRQVLQVGVDRQAKQQSEDAEQNADQQQVVSVDGAMEKADAAQVGKLECSFAAGRLGQRCDGGEKGEGQQ